MKNIALFKRASAKHMRLNMTKAEQKLWFHLRQLPLERTHFRRQVVIGKYIVDFLCIKHRLIIECDGGGHSTQQTYDQERDAWLKSEGYIVLRFWNNEILQNIEGVLEKIMGFIDNPF